MKITEARRRLKGFCEASGKPTRLGYILNRVFCQGGWLCATDGKIAVRVPAPTGMSDTLISDPKGLGLRFPNVVGLGGWSGKAGSPWPRKKIVSKRSDPLTLTRVAGQNLDFYYWGKIADLPGARLAETSVEPQWLAKPIAFVFDGGGQGLVMPVTA